MSEEHKNPGEDANVTAGHVEIADERVDFGQAVFLGAFYTCLALEAVGSIVGYGYTGIWPLAFIGLLNVLVICALASRLHDGDLQAARYVKYVGPVFVLAAAIIGVVGEGSPWSIILTVQLAMPGLFALLASSRPSRIFLASRRGESLDQFPVGSDVEVIQEQSLLTKVDSTIAVREEARQPLTGQAGVIRVIRIVMALCAVAGLVLAVLSTKSLWLAFVLAVTGLSALPFFFVLWNLADNWEFLNTTKGYEKAHLTNVTRDLRILCNCLIGAITVLAVLAMIDLTMR